MFDVAAGLANALENARSGLASAASGTARAETPYGSSRVDRSMAGAAERAVFTEVLLNALHARLAEIKNAAEGR